MTCGGGVQNDTRDKYPELFGGEPCEGEPTRLLECNTDECPGIQMIYFVYIINRGLKNNKTFNYLTCTIFLCFNNSVSCLEFRRDMLLKQRCS